MKNNNLLDKFTETIATTLLSVSEEPGWYLWPMPHFHPAEGNFYLYAPENSFLIQLYNLLKKLRDKNIKDQEIAFLFKKPSRIAAITFLFEGLRQTKLLKEERVRFAMDILNFITFFRKKDPFCEKMQNILWDEHEIRTAIEKTNLLYFSKLSEEKTEKIRKLVGQINAGLFLLCECLYFNHHFIGHEFHGPYKVNNEFVMVIREYYDLKNEFWDFSNDLPESNITSFEIYPKDAEIKFDFFNRVRASSSLSSMLLAVRFKKGGIDGIELDEKGMEELLRSLLNVLKNGEKFINALETKQLLEKYVETKYYILKPLAETLGVEWKIPQEIYEFIRNVSAPQEIKEAFKKIAALPREKQVEICKLIFDPRIDKLSE